MKRLLSFLATILLTVGLHAAEKKAPVPSAKLSDFKIGDLITGPEVNLRNTAGKAVIIEAWGIHCGPCLAFLPHMEKIAKSNRSDTIVIGAHAQDGTPDEIKAVVKKNKLSYSIVNGLNSPISFQGIPQVFVFDTTGTLIYSGSPLDNEFESAVRKAGRPVKSS